MSEIKLYVNTHTKYMKVVNVIYIFRKNDELENLNQVLFVIIMKKNILLFPISHHFKLILILIHYKFL